MTRSVAAPALIAVASGLGLLTFHLVRTPIDIRPVEGQPADSNPAGQLLQPTTLKLRLDGTTPAQLDQTVARPLFWASRRPEPPRAAAPPPPPKRVAIAPPPAEPPAVEFRLTGIVHDGAGAGRALIASPKAPEGSWVEVGTQIEGWRLASIDKRSVRLEAAGRSRVLELP